MRKEGVRRKTGEKKAGERQLVYAGKGPWTGIQAAWDRGGSNERRE